MTDLTPDTTPTAAEESHGLTRRRLLIGGGAAAAAAALAACSSSKKSTATSANTTATTAAQTPSTTGSAGGDAKVAMLAAGLEVLAVGTYQAALSAATANKLGAVPPAVATFIQTAMGQHQQAAAQWNKVLTSAGAQAVTQPPADLKAKVDQAFSKVTDVVGAAQLALTLEKTAADTYLSAIPTLQSKDAITLAGGFQVLAQEHAALLYYALGQYPVPDVFQKTDMAYTPSGG